MCGIVGFYTKELKFDHESRHRLISKMLKLIHHRGPDEYGVYYSKKLTLGHARLSILDLANGKQPMLSYNSNSVLSYNGEVFNYKELRNDLEKAGIKFKTTCDSEVVINAYEYYGNDFLKKLNGQFAIVIYDKNKNSLLLARDHFGILPLFYYKTKNEIVFASEIKSLLAYPGISKEFSELGLFQTLSFWGTIGKQTCFKNIYQVEAGSSLSIKLDSFQNQETKYWDITPTSKISGSFSEHDFAEQLKWLIKDSVNIRKCADVPIGCYLSGGLDSSIIAREIFETGNNQIKSFSVSFESKMHDESFYQNIFFKANPFENCVLKILNNDINKAFEDVVWHAESILFRTAPAPMKLLSEQVRKSQVKVILTGEGADEIFWGYDIFKELKIRNFWKKNITSTWRPLLIKNLFPQYEHFNDDFFSMQKLFYKDSLGYQNDDFFSHSIRIKNNQSVLRFLSNDLKEKIKNFSPEEELSRIVPKSFSEWPILEKCQYLEIKTLLHGYLLSSQGERMAMSNSVELRFPYLDVNIFKFSQSIPDKLKMKVLEEKHILRKAYENILPKEIVTRHKHAYQAPDIRSFIGDNIKNDKIRYYASKAFIEESGIWNSSYVEKILNKYSNYNLKAISFRDNMAIVAIISSMMMYDFFIKGTRIEVDNSSKIDFKTVIIDND